MRSFLLSFLLRRWRALRVQSTRLRRYLDRPLGYRGEQLAARYLRKQGYQIVGRAVRMRGGELDLIAVHNGTVIFVEVKTRRRQLPGESPGESVNAEKERRIARAAFAYLKRHRLLDYPVRFDVITVLWPKGKRPQVQHFPGAFEAPKEATALY